MYNFKIYGFNTFSILICALSTLFFTKSFAQESSKNKRIEILNAKSISLDNGGNVFVSNKDGEIFKFDAYGKKLETYSPQKKANISLLEAWNSIKIFVFFKELQEYVMLERFLTTKSNLNFENTDIGFARLATMGSDYNLWLFDDSDFSLKKFDIQFSKTIFKAPLDLIFGNKDYDLTFIREYQNYLYVNDKNSGVLVFDLYGNYKKNIAIKNVEQFSFYENKLISFSAPDTLISFDLYDFKINKEKIFNQENNIVDLVMNKNGKYILRKNELEIWQE